MRNALHYSPATEQVIVSIKYNETKDSIYIDIIDKGPGVPPDQLEKIFNPFYRVDTSRTKKPEDMAWDWLSHQEQFNCTMERLWLRIIPKEDYWFE